MEIEFPDGPVLRFCAPSAWGPDSMLQQKSKIQKKKEKKRKSNVSELRPGTPK